MAACMAAPAQLSMVWVAAYMPGMRSSRSTTCQHTGAGHMAAWIIGVRQHSCMMGQHHKSAIDL